MLTVHHIGYAVKQMERAMSGLEAIGFQFDNIVKDLDRKISISFGVKDGYRIELVSALKKGSPVDGVLSNQGSSPYHICYQSDDFDNDIRKMTEAGGTE